MYTHGTRGLSSPLPRKCKSVSEEKKPDHPEHKKAWNHLPEQECQPDIPGQPDVACDLLDVLIGGWLRKDLRV